MKLPFTLGSFTFDEQGHEVPEALSDLGGALLTAEHDFPGGTRTHQTFGAFPSPIRWRGKFSGGAAMQRVAQLRQIFLAGQETTLTHGDRSWLGRLVRFAPAIRHQWLYEYEAEFWCRQDQSDGVTAAAIQVANDAAFLSAQVASHLASLQAIVSSAANGTLQQGVLFSAIAPVLLGPVGTFLTSAQALYQTAGGLISAIDPGAAQATLQASLAALAALAPSQASSDPTVASPAWDAAGHVQILQNLLAADAGPRWQETVINPSLPLLAAKYYGDARRWTDIASYNGLTDPQPAGTYTLRIPPP